MQSKEGPKGHLIKENRRDLIPQCPGGTRGGIFMTYATSFLKLERKWEMVLLK